MNAVRRAVAQTGEKKTYFAFVGSGSASEIMERARTAKELGAGGLMVSPAINGFEIVRDLKALGLPILAHSALSYASNTANHGVAFSVFAQLQRLCGADAIVTPAKYGGSFDVMSLEEQVETCRVLLEPVQRIRQSFPAFCGSLAPDSVSLLNQDVGSKDFMIISGSALYDHADGPAAGARSFRSAFEKL